MSQPETLRRKAAGALIGLLVGAFLIAGVYVGATSSATLQAIRHQQVQNSPLLTSTQKAATASGRSLRLIESCVKPGRPCNVRGQKRTAQVVGNISRSSIAAAVCVVKIPPVDIASATQQQLVDRITACVVAQLSHVVSKR